MALVETLPEPTATTPLRQHLRAVFDAPEQFPWLCRAFLAVWCGLLFYFGLTTGQLWKTEGLRAIVAAEMLRSGDWIVPRLYGEPLFTKPPGMYVAIALCSLPFGAVTEWSARLPSALAATLTLLMLYGYFARCFGRRGGLIAAIVIPMCPLWLDKATAAEIDMLQVMWVTGAVLCFLRALEVVDGGRWTVDGGRWTVDGGQWTVDGGRWTVDGEKRDDADEALHLSRSAPSTVHCPPSTVACPPSTLPWMLASLLCVAGGVLTKWTAPAFFYATVLPLLWCGRLRLLWSWQHLVAAAIGASVCLAWIGAAVAQEGWEVFCDTVRREALQRMVPDFAPHPDPWYVSAVHPLVLWYTNLPWSLVALIGCWPGFGRLWDERGKRLWQALHCWIWPNMLIWSLMLDHKRHSFPLFPAIGALAAMVWIAWLSGRLSWKWRVEPRRVLLTALVCWLIAKIAFVEAVMANRHNSRDPAGKAAILAALVPPGAVLYLFQVKDEGIMFYYGRPVLRLASPAELSSSDEPLYCILALDEWTRWQRTSDRAAVVVREMTDEQAAPMVLIRVAR